MSKNPLKPVDDHRFTMGFLKDIGNFEGMTETSQKASPAVFFVNSDILPYIQLHDQSFHLTHHNTFLHF